ncbi:MAG: quaternary amine ABC transporter ATP-binding protein [Candidatus Izemoplasmataceae bacterium]
MPKQKRKVKIEIDNVELIFGKGKNRDKAIEMMHEGASNEDIRKKTGCNVGVKHVDFDVKEGEMFVIVGLSGSGKSSLIRTFNLLNIPTGGEIRIDGENIINLTKEELRDFRRNKISMVFQHFGLLSHRSVLDNVVYGLEVQGIDEEERNKRAMESIEVVGLKGFEHNMPNQLSGGMKQRVGLARALANEPEILLMDEPYSALDPLIRREMQTELLGLEDYIDKTIVFITHDMNEAFKLGDRIALMKDGEIVQMGKPNDFFDNPASDYVKDFIADVDKGQILKAKQVMREPRYVATLGDDRVETYKELEKLDKEFCYVTDEKDVLKGYVMTEDLKKSRAKTIDNVMKTDHEPLYRQLFLKEIFPLLDTANYDVPIVDSKNRLKGVIKHEDAISALI